MMTGTNSPLSYLYIYQRFQLHGGPATPVFELCNSSSLRVFQGAHSWDVGKVDTSPCEEVKRLEIQYV